MHRANEARWRDLESKAHLPEAQAIIRQLIREGIIRVRPRGKNGIQIIPVEEPEYEETDVLEPSPEPYQRQKTGPRPPLHRTRCRPSGKEPPTQEGNRTSRDSKAHSCLSVEH